MMLSAQYDIIAARMNSLRIMIELASSSAVLFGAKPLSIIGMSESFSLTVHDFVSVFQSLGVVKRYCFSRAYHSKVGSTVYEKKKNGGTCLLQLVHQTEVLIMETKRVCRAGGKVEIFLSSDSSFLFRAGSVNRKRNSSNLGMKKIKELVDARDYFNHASGLEVLINSSFVKIRLKRFYLLFVSSPGTLVVGPSSILRNQEPT